MSTIQTKPCPFCQHNSQYFYIPERCTHNYECKYCGNFLFDDMDSDYITQLDRVKKLQIAGVFNERRLKGLSPVFFINGDDEKPIYTSAPQKRLLGITANTDKILQEYPKTGMELFDRILVKLSLSNPTMNPLAPILFQDESSFCLFYATGSTINEVKENFLIIADEMEKLGYIRRVSSSSPVKISIATNGWRRIHELQHTPVGNKRQAFVAMWFDKSRNEYYDNGISKAITAAHRPEFAVSPLRIDHTEHNEKICSQIIESIRQSCYVIADVTGNNAGAYYEAGFAQGMGKPVIWAMDERFFKEKPMHFDIRQYNTVFYNSTDELRDRLATRIRATISLKLIESSIT